MTLGEYIQLLESKTPQAVCPIGLTRSHSWRGIYAQLAFEPIIHVTIELMLRDAKRAIGCFTGYKGGQFEMSEETPINIDYHGENSEGEVTKQIIQVLDSKVDIVNWSRDQLTTEAVELMLARAQEPLKLPPNWAIKCMECNEIFQVNTWTESLLRRLVEHADFLACLGEMLLAMPPISVRSLSVAVSIEGFLSGLDVQPGLSGISLRFFVRHKGHKLVVCNLRES
jgi:hypothetical protein